MKLPPTSNDTFNVVAVGAWNPAIFSPEWVKEYLADDKGRDVIMAIPMPPGSLPPRLTVDGINLYPSPVALSADCVEYSDAGIAVCAGKIGRIANLLSHTPISAVGVNFRFWGDLGDSEVLADLFTFRDAGKISTEFVASGALIKRAFRLSDATILNLTVDTFSDHLQVEFNFHSDVRRMSDVAAKTSAERILAARSQALAFLHDAYNIVIET